MILRKPYAILIKYFRLIHIIMFLFFGYFVFVLRKIYLFFSEYIAAGSFTYFENMVSRYVPAIVFFMVILLLGLSIGIFFLMNKKQKPVLFYRILIGYCILLLGVFIYFFSFFKSLDDTLYEPLRIVVNRDIILFVYLINYFFVAFAFIRGFGFDIKKFSFDKDKKELHLDESDSEEYELNINIEKEDILSYVNRQKREFKYYFKENALFFTIVGGIAIISILLYLYYDIFVINRVYKEGDIVKVREVAYKVNNSNVTDKDKYGRVVSKDNDFLIISINITNNQATGYLDGQALRVHIGDEYYYPNSTSCELFSDIGTCYKNQELKVNTSNDFIIVYKINKNHKKIFLEILKNKGDEYQYNRILLSSKEYEVENVNYNINDVFKIEDNDFKIIQYGTYHKTSYEYEECQQDVCNTFTKNVTPKTGELVLAIEIENIDKLSDEFLSSAIGIEYGTNKINGKDLKMIARSKRAVYYSVPMTMRNNSAKMIITTRTKIYNFLLEGGYYE